MYSEGIRALNSEGLGFESQLDTGIFSLDSISAKTLRWHARHSAEVNENENLAWVTVRTRVTPRFKRVLVAY